MSAAQKVDVLTVLRRMSAQAQACRSGGAGSGTQNSEDESAIAAVAGLIEAQRQIKHSIQQARIPGNDWKRELVLIENTVDAALARVGGAA